MPQDLSYESEELCFFGTIRTINSRLWLINNPKLDERILAHVAKYQEMYGVIIYAFIIMGNHYHIIACFPRRNKAAFFQALNGMISKLVARYVKEFGGGGKLWARRIRCQAIVRPEDIEKQVLYAALNPVNAGLSRTLRGYRSYNSFSDAASGRVRKYTIVNWEDYNNRRRFNSALTPNDCATDYELKFSRIPGYEDLSKSEYEKQLFSKLELERTRIVNDRIQRGEGFADSVTLLKQKPGTAPRSTKTSRRDTHRPLILTQCIKTKEAFHDWYFSMLVSYKQASKKFREGIKNVVFPENTYLPRCSSSVST